MLKIIGEPLTIRWKFKRIEKSRLSVYRCGENEDKCYFMRTDPNKTYGKNKSSVLELSYSHIRDTAKMDFLREINAQKRRVSIWIKETDNNDFPDKFYVFRKSLNTKPVDIKEYQIKYEEECK